MQDVAQAREMPTVARSLKGCFSSAALRRAGDIVWFAPGEKHWHGASGNTAMAHVAIAEALDGKTVDWMEKVSDEQYRAG
ncbi:MAG: Cupin 2 conserved barrel domain protein [Microvirga sp.]|nr:Cupin 2 conserved barrel domain protein [Microvirga sp.]